MKYFLIIALLLLASGTTLAQADSDTKHAAYYRCTENIQKDPHQAYEYCSDYLNKYPNDDPRLVEYAGRFVTAYKKISHYLESVSPANFVEKAPGWAVYRAPSPAIIPAMDSPHVKYPITITRDYSSPEEEKLLAKAESVYKNPDNVELQLLKDWSYFAQKYAELPDGEPRWWTGQFDTILGTEVVTTEAVLYYYNISQAFRNKNGVLKENTFTFWSSSLKYEDSIKKLAAYERAGKSFTNVYVANMTLTWSQTCGGLCGFGFTRNKIVVLSPSGEILEMFLDDPVNRRTWVR